MGFTSALRRLKTVFGFVRNGTYLRQLKSGEIWYYPTYLLFRFLRNCQVERTPPLESVYRPDYTHLDAVLLTNERFLPDLLYAVKTFARHYGAPIRFHLYPDRSVGDAALARMRRHLPHAVLLSRAERDQIIVPELEKRGLHACMGFRDQLPHSAKIIDASLLIEASGYLLLDSDTVALRTLTDLRKRIDQWTSGCIFGCDVGDSYVYPYAESRNDIRRAFSQARKHWAGLD